MIKLCKKKEKKKREKQEMGENIYLVIIYLIQVERMSNPITYLLPFKCILHIKVQTMGLKKKSYKGFHKTTNHWYFILQSEAYVIY